VTRIPSVIADVEFLKASAVWVPSSPDKLIIGRHEGMLRFKLLDKVTYIVLLAHGYGLLCAIPKLEKEIDAIDMGILQPR